MPYPSCPATPATPTMPLFPLPQTAAYYLPLPGQDLTGSRMSMPWRLFAQGSSSSYEERSLVPIVPASFLSLLLLDSSTALVSPVEQRILLRCLLIAHHRVPELLLTLSLSRLLIQAPAPLWFTVGPHHQH